MDLAAAGEGGAIISVVVLFLLMRCHATGAGVVDCGVVAVLAVAVVVFDFAGASRQSTWPMLHYTTTGNK